MRNGGLEEFFYELIVFNIPVIFTNPEGINQIERKKNYFKILFDFRLFDLHRLFND